MTNIDKAINILQKTNDGEDLSPQDLVCSASNLWLTPDYEARRF